MNTRLDTPPSQTASPNFSHSSGGTLGQLNSPVHGKPSQVRVEHPGHVFSGLSDRITVGRYHSLHVLRDDLPTELRVTAATDDGIVMGLEHVTLPVAAVQFHPESIMSLGQDAGLRMIENAIVHLTQAARRDRGS